MKNELLTEIDGLWSQLLQEEIGVMHKLDAVKAPFFLMASKNVKSFKITVKLANGKPLSKKYVYMKINGKTYKARTTSKGVVTFKFLLPKKTKTYSYKVKYYGEYGYSAKTYSGKLKVR